MIRILKPGLLTTVQDLGRFGFAHLGVSAAGAADALSYRIANLLVGNAENAPALEMTLLGPIIEFQEAATVSITGSATSTGLALNECFTVRAGERIEFGSLISGARSYLAVRGGFEVPMVMNSASTFLAAAFGGHHGRALRTGDELSIGSRTEGPPCRLKKALASPPTASRPLRTVPAPQANWFDESTVNAFFAANYRVSDLSNRSGLRLTGEAIAANRRDELVTEGIALGAVQVPPDGQPIILFVDQQTTGGYPKIANVITADLPRVGQLRSRDEVKFQMVEQSDAIELLRQQERWLREVFER